MFETAHYRSWRELIYLQVMCTDWSPNDIEAASSLTFFG